MRRLAVVGGGIAGLAAAWFAAERGFDVVVLEASARVGGKLRVTEVGGVPVDVGAEALLAVRPEGVGLLDAAGLADDRIAPLTTSAHIRAGGQLFALPTRTMLGIPGDPVAARASGVLSEQALAAITGEPSLPPLAPVVDDIAVGSLVRARLGDEVADRLVEPLLGGVYAGRADQLSLRATMPALARRLAGGGSLVEAAAAVAGSGTRSPDAGPVFASLRGGLGRLPGVLAASGRFEVRTSVTVRSIRRTEIGFALETGAEPVAELVDADAVIVAAPAAKAARLLRDLAAGAAGELAAIESASLATVSFAFDDVTPPEGSGLLVAAGERLAVKALTMTSRKWPVESGNLTLLRVSVGRVGEPQALQFDDADLVRLVRGELRTLTGIAAEPVDAVVTRWGGGLPQYAVGHVERIARVRGSIATVPGLAVCGAAYDGVGVPACIGSARDAVARIIASLPPRGQ
ncbi:MAG: protoporphyrinogen oxidase [Jatrophihabitans sp.]